MASEEEERRPDVPSGRRRWLLPAALGLLAAAFLGGATVYRELANSIYQSRYFSRIAAELSYEVGPGPSATVRFPATGPYDRRMGYAVIPAVQARLEAQGFEVVQQARVSDRFGELMDLGLFPVYGEKDQGGLALDDRRGMRFHATPHPARAYERFDSVPELLWRTLLFIENREFLDPERPRRNPAVEWDRLGRGAVELVLNRLGREGNVPGGSTLATQLEKFRHSPDGRTGSPLDKLRQIASASLRAYREGEETLEAQRRILVAYLNSVPLAGQRGHGEVIGTADGLRAWFGTDFDHANRLLRGVALGPGEEAERAQVYRQALSLLIAQRRPAYYLGQQAGREELDGLADQYLGLLRNAGVIPDGLAAAALAAPTQVLAEAPPVPRASFVARKAANQIRSGLLTLLDAPNLYDLDRYDLRVEAGLDFRWQESVAEVLGRMADPAFLASNGFADTRLLDSGDPGRVVYAFTLLETTPLGNVVRVQTDNYESPLNLSAGARLELGSTAKLRTLASYLEAIEDVYVRVAALPPDSLAAFPVVERDPLSRWVVDRVAGSPGTGLMDVLRAAMLRQYSASPAERFATGGGVQTFSNFDDTYDGRVLTVLEAFRQSVNLPAVRVMRDVVSHYMFRSPRTTAGLLEDADDPGRIEYLRRFADDEGSRFLRRFYRKYEGRQGPELVEALVAGRSLGPVRTAWAYRSVAPAAPLDAFAAFVTTHTPNSSLALGGMEALYRQTDPTPHPIQDLGFLANVHPLELWLVRHLLDNPGASVVEVLAAGAQARQDVYGWLFRTRSRGAQDTRIRTMIELEAFEEILQGWQRLGYPFDNIVPSYGTAIGSSGDRPLALSELMGIILNGGIRYPVVRVEEVHLAAGTPFETRLRRRPATGERVMSEAVAQVLREALFDVVENGTGRRVRGAFVTNDGRPIAIGGKTGTGDNRFRVYAAGGQLVESRAVSRTATFAFFAGDRYFGVVTAYVPGPEADDFRFTSALPAQLLRVVGPTFDGLLPAPAESESGGG